MTRLDTMEIRLDGVGHALSDRQLEVPLYQRSYAWTKKQINDLYQDISDAILNGEAEYFLGSIVVIKRENSREEVVDGQQRLATLSILLGAIRNYFAENSEVQRADIIQSQFLLLHDRNTLEVQPRLKLNSTDHDFFLNQILMRRNLPDITAVQRQSNERLFDATHLATEWVRNVAQQTRSPISQLLKWVNYIENSLRTIWVEVPNAANAFMIFETLNDRGLRLSASDLLKNYLFGSAENRINEVQRSWIAMTGALSTIDEEEIVVPYIRHYWSSLYGPTRERDLYDSIRRRVTSVQGAVTLANDLESSAAKYAALLNPQHDFWNQYGATARKHLETLLTLRMEQNRPLLLALLDKFNEQDVKESLRIIVSWSVRFLIVGGLGGGVMERHYSDRAREVRNGEIQNANQLSEAMSRIVPGDEQFRSEFFRATVSQTYLARYYLQVLEKQAQGELEPELVPNDNQEQINLEHILPQNLTAGWEHINEDTARALYKRIGNLALLSQRVNSRAGNDSFEAKKEYYQQSNFLLTREAAEKSSWGMDEIGERQTRLAELAVRAWRL